MAKGAGIMTLNKGCTLLSRNVTTRWENIMTHLLGLIGIATNLEMFFDENIVNITNVDVDVDHTKRKY